MGQELRFYARGTGLVSLPNERRIVGALPRYIGRKARKEGETVVWPATETPHVADAGTDTGRRLVKRCARGELWAADAATAAACGVPFVPLTFADGVWTPSPPPAPAARAKTIKD